ncbi:hypothetical protein M6B38_139310 [Iris pallida]|uniref:Uncharacterized protein n=1 Tax=Iris pallida TaxID=29817 RepID=A0AAX6FDK4_IRIPA|nr:hypothetical protein M6B38_139310 [Iris pallida]
MSPSSMAEGQKSTVGNGVEARRRMWYTIPALPSHQRRPRSHPPLTVAHVRSNALCRHHMLISLLFVRHMLDQMLLYLNSLLIVIK